MTTSQPTLPGLPEVDPRPNDADRVRDALARRAQRLDARFPKALDLEARVLVAMASPLRGVASVLSGTHCPEHWREALRGERSLPLDDLCRLATEPTREAHEAVVGAVMRLAEAVGYVVEPIEGRGGSLARRCSEAADAATRLLGDLARAQEDGRVDVTERETLRSRIDVLKRAATDCEAALGEVAP